MVKNLAANIGDMGSIPGLGRSPEEGNGNQLQYSCLENPMDRGAQWATVHGIARVGHDLETNHHHDQVNHNGKQNNYLFFSKPRRRQWQPTPVLLSRKSHGGRSPVGFSPWGRQSWTRLSDFTFTFHFHALEKEMATRSSVPAWRIPWTEKPCGLQSMGSQRDRQH